MIGVPINVEPELINEQGEFRDIDFDGDPWVIAPQIDFHSASAVERDGKLYILTETLPRDLQGLQSAKQESPRHRQRYE